MMLVSTVPMMSVTEEGRVVETVMWTLVEAV